jgi:phage recombination protein Bet
METQKNEGRGTEKAIVQYKGQPVTITFHDVKTLICPLATDQEAAIFLKTCQSLQLSPFAGEIYLIKYSEKDKAATVIAIDAYEKAAEQNPEFDGYEAGIILDFGGRLDYREGAFLLEKEREHLVGGWARVYRKDRSRPFYVAVNKKECLRYRRDGSLTEFWTAEKQPSMLRKVALKRALVEAFPSLFSGTISNVDYETVPAEVKEIVPEPRGETPEGQLPPALEKNGKPDWRKFWARVKSELGLTTGQARELLQVDSIKKELIDAGWTMERIWDKLVEALRQRQPPENDREEITRKAEVTEAKAKKSKRDPETIKTIQDLYQACHEDFDLQPKDVLRELGYRSQMDIVETPAECYRRIRAVRGV